MPMLVAPQAVHATELPLTFREPNLVQCGFPSFQYRGPEHLLSQIRCLCGFSKQDLDPRYSDDPSSPSSAGLQELSPVLGCGSLPLLPSVTVGSMMTIRVVIRKS